MNAEYYKWNDYDVRTNPLVWSHDPSMMWDQKWKKYYSYSTDVYRPKYGLTSPIGIPVRSSRDLITFKYEGTTLSEQAVQEGRRNENNPDTINFWAPYVECVLGEYRMYYSATKAFGSSESRIWLAVADNPLGPFENRGVAVDTWGTDDTLPNGIDPHIVWADRKCYLVYGSFFGGIYIKELDEKTGLPSDGDAKSLGICISKKAEPPVLDGPEGGAVIYVPETAYYYLFQSYGWLGDNYDIRVGRSRTVKGPYLDREGKKLAGESMGVKLAGSYQFDAAIPKGHGRLEKWQWAGLRGPGHGVPFHDPVSEKYFFVHHIRDGALVHREYDQDEMRASYNVHFMMIRPMFFRDGWPVLGPEPYQGENFEPVPPEDVEGCWEVITFDERNDGIKKSVKCWLDQNSTYLKNGYIYRCKDIENRTDTCVVTGYDDSGLAYWGKFLYSDV